MNKNLKLLAISLGLLFFGWNAAEQHLTSFYQSIQGKTQTGLNSLSVLYASIIIGSFLGPATVRKFGHKKSMIFGFLTYTSLVFTYTTTNNVLITIFSALLGIGCGISGVAQIDLIRIFSPERFRGKTVGRINMLRTIGGALGVFSVSLLLRYLGIRDVYFGLTIIMALGTTMLFWLENPEISIIEKESLTVSFRKTLSMSKNKMVLLALPSTVANGFLLGLVLGAIPATVSKSFGLERVGIVMAFFHLTLSFSGLYSGKMSDFKGRYLFLYLALSLAIASAILILISQAVGATIFAMILAGFSSATFGVVFSALYIDLFKDKVKEAQAANNILGNLLGIIPAFILSNYFSTNHLLCLAISLCFLGAVSLFWLEKSTNFNAIN